MKRQYSAFDWASLIGTSSIFVAMFISIAVREHPDWGRINIFASVWLMIGFFVITLMIGTLKGEHRTKIKVPKAPTVMIFALSIFLYLNGMPLGGQI